MSHTRSGFTLMEVLVASLIASLVTGGTLMAFVTAARISKQTNSPQRVEALTLANDTIERFRNRVAADDTFFSSTAPQVWVSDLLPASGGPGSILSTSPPPKRCYRVIPEDCDGNGTPGNCYALQVRVCWRDTSDCPSPC